MATESRSYAPDVRYWNEEEEEQGPRVFYRGERRGSNTLEVGVVGMGYTVGSCYGDKIENMVRFLCERRRGK